MAEMSASTVVGKYVTLELLQKPAEHFTVRGPDFALHEQNAVFNC